MGPLDTLNSGAFSGLLIFFQVLGALISVAFIGGAMYAWTGKQEVDRMLAEKRNQHFQISKKSTASPIKKRWVNIAAMFQSPDPNAWRIAIIDADSMLEELITQMGFNGETFGEKLKNMNQSGIPWTDAAWDVHLLRNKLAHEGSRYPLNDREAYRAFKIYENIFFETGFLA